MGKDPAVSHAVELFRIGGISKEQLQAVDNVTPN